jgi:hypothetical protein
LYGSVLVVWSKRSRSYDRAGRKGFPLTGVP